MGFGDEILVTGEAKRLQQTDPRPVMVLDRAGRHRWHPLWEGNPRILKPGVAGRCQKLVNGAGCRPYVDYKRMQGDFKLIYPDQKFSTKRRHPELPYRYTSHKCTRGELYFTKRGPPEYVVIEPHFKEINLNRDWGWDRWQSVVDSLDLPWVQISQSGKRVLNGVRHMPANNQLDACRRLAKASLYVGPEGGLYHAAAALGVSSVAIFGGFVSPDNQGYDDSINIYERDGSPCGQRVTCGHCRKAMDKIKPSMVIAGITKLLQPAESVKAAV